MQEGERVVIEMQTVDQTLHGRETRGSGLVVCSQGMALIERIAHEIITQPIPAHEMMGETAPQGPVATSSSDGEEDDV